MIADEIHRIAGLLPKGTRLVAISKFHPAEAIMEAYAAGQRIFGESHVQELRAKQAALPQDVEWHFIGHLQTNKVKYIAPYVSLIHAIDTPRLLTEVERQAARAGRTIRCLLQLHVAQEETKFGFTPEECLDFLREGAWRTMTHVQLSGVMCMASNVDDEAQVRSEFRRAHDFFLQAKQEFFADTPVFCECSMGMSDDWPIAVEEGATLVRIGTAIFGARQY